MTLFWTASHQIVQRMMHHLHDLVCIFCFLSILDKNGAYTLCIGTVFHQNAQKTKDANPIVQMMHHHLHDLVRSCQKHVNMHYFCMYTTGEIQKLVSENVGCRLCR